MKKSSKRNLIRRLPIGKLCLLTGLIVIAGYNTPQAPAGKSASRQTISVEQGQVKAAHTEKQPAKDTDNTSKSKPIAPASVTQADKPAKPPSATTTAKAAANASTTKQPNTSLATPVPAGANTSDIASDSVCPGQSSLASTQTVLVCMTAYARTQHGLSTTTASSSLMAAAAAKAQDIASCEFSHTACGRPFNYWFTNKGYTGSCSSENIALGQPNPGAVFNAWMNSAGHRANILGTNYRHIGVAALPSSKGTVWTMALGGC